MLKIQQVKRLALQNAQGSTGEGVPRRVGARSAAVAGGLRLSAGVAFGALWRVLQRAWISVRMWN